MPTTIRIPDELRDAIDAVRGDVPRDRWVQRSVRRALEATLSEAEGVPCSEQAGPAPVSSWPPAAREDVRPAASPRTHDPDVMARQARLNEAKYGKPGRGRG